MQILFLVNFLIDLFLSPPETKQAYLDPGSGSILIQLLVAAALGALIVFRTSWGRIRSLFGRPPEEDEDEDEDGDDED